MDAPPVGQRPFMRRGLPASLLAALLLAGTAPVAGAAPVVEEYGRTVARDEVTLSMRATAPYSGMTCDTGQLSLTLARSRG